MAGVGLKRHLMAHNISTRLGKVHRVMVISLCKTLAAKHQLSLAQVFGKYRAIGVPSSTPRSRPIKRTRSRPGKKPLGGRIRWSALSGGEQRALSSLPSDRFVSDGNGNWGSELVKRLRGLIAASYAGVGTESRSTTSASSRI